MEVSVLTGILSPYHSEKERDIVCKKENTPESRPHSPQGLGGKDR